MNRIVFLGSLLFVLISCSKQPECESFKVGSFIVPIDTEGGEPYRIIRKDSLQTEIDSKGVKIYSTISWLSKCSYVLKYDENKMKLKDYQKQINSVGGLIVNVTKTDGNCFYFTSKIKGEAESERIDGVMCKDTKLSF